MNRYWSHIHHFVNAKKRHGIHSPFVYQLSDECLSVPWDQSDRDLLKKQFKILNQNQQIIRITDFGAGSKHMGNERKISDIFKNSRSSKRYAQLLYQLSRFYQPKRILELALLWPGVHCTCIWDILSPSSTPLKVVRKPTLFRKIFFL